MPPARRPQSSGRAPERTGRWRPCLNICSLTNRWQVSLLAHELQHALEIGRRPEVHNVDAMELLYESIGFPTVRDGSNRHFETEAAIAVQRAVNEELGDARTSHGGMAY